MQTDRWLLLAVLAAGLLLGCAADGDEVPDQPTAAAGGEPTAEPTASQGQGVRGPVYLERTELLVMESYPIQLALHLEGNLPTPCHSLAWDVMDPEQGEIAVEVYSTIPLGLDCIQVLEPFEETIQLGALEGGSFTVTVNGEEVGTVDA